MQSTRRTSIGSHTPGATRHQGQVQHISASATDHYAPWRTSCDRPQLIRESQPAVASTNPVRGGGCTQNRTGLRKESRRVHIATSKTLSEAAYQIPFALRLLSSDPVCRSPTAYLTLTRIEPLHCSFLFDLQMSLIAAIPSIRRSILPQTNPGQSSLRRHVHKMSTSYPTGRMTRVDLRAAGAPSCSRLRGGRGILGF